MSDKTFEPDWLSVPGSTIAALLEREGISVDKFAKQMGLSIERAGRLLTGRTTITHRVAESLEGIIGGSAQFWISREQQYRNDIARLQSMGSEDAAKAWLNELPLQEMIKFGWITPKANLRDKIDSSLEFFGVSDVASWRSKYSDLLSAVAFRTSWAFESEPGAVISWLRYAHLRSSEIECKTWNLSKFHDRLSTIRELTRHKNPTSFVPQLRRICADCGVALVIARTPKGCHASGATQFITPKKAMILLSFRYLSDDQFWFTFFHEAGHLILHSEQNLFLEDESDVTSTQERQANDFAADMLIPTDAREELASIPLNKLDIIKFSVEVGVSRGLVVGQLQHMKRIKPDQFNWMKRRFKWDDVEV